MLKYLFNTIPETAKVSEQTPAVLTVNPLNVGKSNLI